MGSGSNFLSANKKQTPSKSNRSKWNIPAKKQLVHTCIRMIPDKFLDVEDDYVHNASDSTARSAWKEPDLEQNPRKLMDYNFYRKVSKYDLDKLCVDWSEY